MSRQDNYAFVYKKQSIQIDCCVFHWDCLDFFGVGLCWAEGCDFHAFSNGCWIDAVKCCWLRNNYLSHPFSVNSCMYGIEFVSEVWALSMRVLSMDKTNKIRRLTSIHWLRWYPSLQSSSYDIGSTLLLFHRLFLIDCCVFRQDCLVFFGVSLCWAPLQWTCSFQRFQPMEIDSLATAWLCFDCFSFLPDVIGLEVLPLSSWHISTTGLDIDQIEVCYVRLYSMCWRVGFLQQMC
jgi:hypothetical protein